MSDTTAQSTPPGAAICPQCGAASAGSVCTACGLYLGDPRIGELHRMNADLRYIATLRDDLLHQIRADATQASTAPRSAHDEAAFLAGMEPPDASQRLEAIPLPEPSASAAAADAPAAVARPGEVLAPPLFDAAAFSPAPATAPADDAAAALAEDLAPAPTEPVATGVTADVTAGRTEDVTTTSVPPRTDAAPPPSSPASPPPRPATPPSRGRRLTIPVLLLIVGVSLVGIAAIFFVTLAWFVAGIEVRALIMAAITAGVIATATILRRRELTATAEGIAALALLLLGLDGWAVRANNLFDTGQTNPLVYAGVVLLVLAGLSRLWSALSRLRAPDIAAVLLLPVGVFLLVAGLAGPSGTGVFWGLVGAAVAGVLQRAPIPWSAARPEHAAERITLGIIGIAAALASVVALIWLLPSDTYVPLWAGPIVVAVTLLNAHGILRNRDLAVAGPLAHITASLGVLTAATLGLQVSFRDPTEIHLIVLAPLCALLVAVLTDLFAIRSRLLEAARFVGFGAALLVTAAAAIAMCLWMPPWAVWTTPAFAAVSLPAGLAVVTALAFAGASFGTPSARDARVRNATPTASTILLLIVGAYTGSPALVAAFGAVAVGASLIALSRNVPTRKAWLLSAATGAVVPTVACIASFPVWIVTVGIALVTPLLVARVLHARGSLSTGLASCTIAVALGAAIVLPVGLAAVTGSTLSIIGSAALLGWVGVVLLGGCAVPNVSTDLRRVLGFSGAAAVFVSLATTIDTPATMDVARLLGEPALAPMRTTLAVIVIVFLLVRLRPLAAGEWAAAVVLAPTVAATAFSALTTMVPTWSEIPVASFAALIPVAWFAITLPAQARMAADAGTGVTVFMLLLAAGAETPLFFEWPRSPVDLLTAAVIIAGMSVSRGWAAAETDAIPGVPSTPADGVPTVTAPRRTFIWFTISLAAAAFWVWGAQQDPLPPTELIAVPLAIVLVAFAALLVWLRRFVEATVATAAGFGFGLIVPAVATFDRDPIRAGTLFAVAAICALLFAWPPLRRLRDVATVATAVSLVAAGMVTVQGMWTTAELPLLWFGALTAVVLAAAFGMRGGSVPQRVLALVAMPLVFVLFLVVGRAYTLPSVVALIVVNVCLGAIHVASAWRREAPLGAATRWSALGTLVVLSAFSVTWSRSEVPEAVTLPLAAMLVGGAVASWLRDAREAHPLREGDVAAWFSGVVVALGGAFAAELTTTRVWVVLAACIVGALLCALYLKQWALSIVTSGILMLGAVILGVMVLARVSTGEGVAAVPYVASVAAVATAVAVTSSVARSRLPEHPAGIASIFLIAGATILCAAAIGRAPTQLPLPAGLTLLVLAAAAIAAAYAVRWRVWARAAASTAGGLVAIAVIVTARQIHAPAEPAAFELQPDLWLYAFLLLSAAVGFAASRSSRVPAVWIGAGWSVVVALAAVNLLLPVFQTPSIARTLLAIVVFTVIAGAGYLGRARYGILLPITGTVALVVVGAAAMSNGVRPVELVTVVPALAAVGVGVIEMRRDDSLRSWVALGPGLALLVLPSLAYDMPALDNALWRIVAVGLVAVAMVVFGAVTRLQAPLVLGSAVALAHGVAQLWPWIASAYVSVEWWVWLGLGGIILIVLAARYERQMPAFRRAFTAVTSLR